MRGSTLTSDSERVNVEKRKKQKSKCALIFIMRSTVSANKDEQMAMIIAIDVIQEGNHLEQSNMEFINTCSTCTPCVPTFTPTRKATAIMKQCLQGCPGSYWPRIGRDIHPYQPRARFHQLAQSVTTVKYFCIKLGGPIFFQFEIIINVLVSSFCFILIPMLWVYGYYKCLIFSGRGSSLDVGIWRPWTSDSNV